MRPVNVIKVGDKVRAIRNGFVMYDVLKIHFGHPTWVYDGARHEQPLVDIRVEGSTRVYYDWPISFFRKVYS